MHIEVRLITLLSMNRNFNTTSYDSLIGRLVLQGAPEATKIVKKWHFCHFGGFQGGSWGGQKWPFFDPPGPPPKKGVKKGGFFEKVRDLGTPEKRVFSTFSKKPQNPHEIFGGRGGIPHFH